MYNPVLGRFLERDPIGYAGNSVNLYQYCGDSPCAKRDPLGLTETTYYDASGPYYQLAWTLHNIGPDGHWGQTTAHLEYRAEEYYSKWDCVCDPSCPNGRRYTYEILASVEYIASDITVLLPNWTDYGTGTAEEKQAWDRMIAALKLHESAHVAIFGGFSGHQDTYGTGSACTLGEAHDEARLAIATSAAQMFIRRKNATDEINRNYDAITAHGKNQGVDLPQI